MGAQLDNSNAVLGQALGVYRERPAAAPLRRHFSLTWFHTLPAGAERQTVIVPDGCADLIWTGKELRIAGPDRQAKIEHISPGTTFIGLRFQPAAAAAWLRTPLSELVGTRAQLERFWGNEAVRLGDFAGDAKSFEEAASRLEQALTAKSVDIDEPDQAAGFIFRFVAENPSPQPQLIRRLCEHLDMSERTLRRRCHAAFGYGPKTLDRILRFQHFMRLARSPGSAGLAELAAEAGYADQPHLSRETRELAGLAPSAIVAQIAT